MSRGSNTAQGRSNRVGAAWANAYNDVVLFWLWLGGVTRAQRAQTKSDVLQTQQRISEEAGQQAVQPQECNTEGWLGGWWGGERTVDRQACVLQVRAWGLRVVRARARPVRCCCASSLSSGSPWRYHAPKAVEQEEGPYTAKEPVIQIRRGWAKAFSVPASKTLYVTNPPV